MKRLLILRHAKSSWNNAELSDFERPLNKRGRQAAPRMGYWIAENDIAPDVVICSTARRAQQTYQLVQNAVSWDVETIHTEKLYLAPAHTYIEHLSQLADNTSTAMVIGHNPGMEELVFQLCGEYHPMPTCALAVIAFDMEVWWKLLANECSGQLQHHVLPRDLA